MKCFRRKSCVLKHGYKVEAPSRIKGRMNETAQDNAIVQSCALCFIVINVQSICLIVPTPLCWSGGGSLSGKMQCDRGSVSNRIYLRRATYIL